MKTALLIAFHFPPAAVSSGLQRSLSNTRHLLEADWKPVVLTANPRAHPRTDDGQLRDIPASVPVTGAFALDASRHLAVKGRYMKWLALPDPWISWWLGGLISGLKLVRRHKPSVIWSTYPIATAHLIGLTLNRLTGLPWIADFRDPMTQEGYPPNKMKFALYQWIERHTVAKCTFAVFTTAGTAELYRARYPEQPPSKWQFISNGYEEHIFDEVEATTPISSVGHKHKPLKLLHSGVIYPSERNPTAFFQAIAELQESGQISRDRVKVVLRATGHDQLLQKKITSLGIDTIVELAPVVPYREAIAESFTADGLLVLQGNSCNEQIPAKLYEYFRTGQPILALADPVGDTGKVSRAAGLDLIVPLEDKEQIKSALLQFLDQLEQGTALAVPKDKQKQYGRKEGVIKLAALFDRAITAD